MATLIDRLQLEHRTLERLVRLLDAQPSLAPEADAGWQAIAQSVTSVGEDPLLRTPTEERFRQLHRVIADEAGCGCPDPVA